MFRGRRRGSLTVEAALVLPLFLFACLSIIYINQLIACEERVQWALTRTAREVSVEYAVSEKGIMVSHAYLAGKMRRYLSGDDLAVSMLRSGFDPETDELTLVADFQVRIPFPGLAGRRVSFTERIRTRAFTGVTTRFRSGDRDEQTIVYVTETGTVYHRDLSCSHLTLSISQVKYGDLEHLRSENGGKYYACEGCCRSRSFAAGEDVFICNYGDRFHSSRVCTKIKRNIREISLSEVGSRLPCSKCGKE